MDQDVKTELENLTRFLHEHMLTKEEFDQKIETLPTKESFSQLQTSVEGIAKRYKDHDDDLKIIGERTSRMERWVVDAAKKIGISYRP